RSPAGQTLWRKQFSKKERAVMYTPRRKVCGSCALKSRCTLGPRRYVSRNLHEDALQRMQQRTTAEVMRLRGSTVEHPFATIKYRIFGHPRFLLRGTGGAQTEISLATMVYNLKRMLNVFAVRYRPMPMRDSISSMKMFASNTRRAGRTCGVTSTIWSKRTVRRWRGKRCSGS